MRCKSLSVNACKFRILLASVLNIDIGYMRLIWLLWLPIPLRILLAASCIKEMNKTSNFKVAAAETYFDVLENDEASCRHLSCSFRPVQKPQLLQSPWKDLPWLSSPISIVYRPLSSNEFLVRYQFSLGERFILSIEVWHIAYKRPRRQTRITYYDGLERQRPSPLSGFQGPQEILSRLQWQYVSVCAIGR